VGGRKARSGGRRGRASRYVHRPAHLTARLERSLSVLAKHRSNKDAAFIIPSMLCSATFLFIALYSSDGFSSKLA